MFVYKGWGNEVDNGCDVSVGGRDFVVYELCFNRCIRKGEGWIEVLDLILNNSWCMYDLINNYCGLMFVFVEWEWCLGYFVVNVMVVMLFIEIFLVYELMWCFKV